MFYVTKETLCKKVYYYSKKNMGDFKLKLTPHSAE